MAQFKDWIHAARLRTLPLSVSGILVGSLLALQNGFWNPVVFTLALSTTLLFQILSNLANDLGDTLKGADNANRVGPERAVQSGAISISAMKTAVSLTAILSFISAGLLIWKGTANLSENSVYGYIALAFACVVAAITYTMGKRAYGYFGLGDVFVFIFFGCVSVIGVYPLFADELIFELIFPAITIGLLSTAVLNLNNMRDQINDAAVGKRTLVVKLGFKNAKAYHLTLIITAMLSWIIFLAFKQHWIGFISCLPFVLLVKHIVFVVKNNEPSAFDPELKKVALSTFFIAVLYTISVVIVVWKTLIY
ncbi:MAG: 1,4-dihydroxy-2-naphthoate octaprenyltransferase [Candidatus Fluviicola riflensis]|nr:MAG: 1,4-dihydroxy-2-naphthoate octaprenyltransferase [Candidatus Fluviicola riflensis]OGS78877.1 MAG: 1,4-dihydroxy-2-naphthoate octaprenyltransferase [Candidatus Fluviicola riflensis]OGS85899.1 MAG: 1,4-dihydroxy-2-naphthoate octaprenyltransferase [Fluviicola sp. RIFCSPHIGHO2_12_FULL_43_24]OGS86308.1 MAG: 1,4-dihydroxy-2-naphthoate octaprenyltransferase [Fluviicola sp. RIFCSPHIGHO2_01_FULL_43_53]